ncbi:flagellar hook-basal body complex protein FliE [Acetobacter sp. AN02]|uniref:flagellar hook-basal body complex protein FliE n=1 Tax=Acetobacter sp. AN02 TaxID=2894186 RepID=UPI002434599F|nr:flagellar hook-basal body complex protein FliE [Acetobacter sp. AN02]MDG6095654.1 flagellar hook-basal body complex protein FliE [Acetobacter sp. AN02]
MKISSFTDTAQAAAAYSRTQKTTLGGNEFSLDDASSAGKTSDFSSIFQDAVQGFLDRQHTAEAKATEGLSGHGNLTDIVTSVSDAQVALQTATGIRDRIIQSYQEIMRMSV